MRIASASLEVRDKSKMATFSGNVHVIQGALDLRSNTLLVFYEEISGVKKVADNDRTQQQIRRIEARGSVTITQKISARPRTMPISMCAAIRSR